MRVGLECILCLENQTGSSVFTLDRLRWIPFVTIPESCSAYLKVSKYQTRFIVGSETGKEDAV